MKLWTFLTSLAATAGVCALALTSQGAVQNTKHNMNLVFGANTIQDNQVCLPCHAPHNQPDPTQGFLWNHVMPANGYTYYAGGSIGTTVEGKATIVGLDDTSLKCLSCHDGTVAVDSYGGYQFAAAPAISTFNNTVGTHFVNGAGTGFLVGQGTQNLSNDHPVGVTYPGLSNDGKTWTTTSSFNNPLTAWTKSTYTGYNAASVPTVLNYVNDAGANISTAGGGIGFGTTGTYNNVIGCGTCHTPHTDTYNFLVISNTNSQLCLTCHAK